MSRLRRRLAGPGAAVAVTAVLLASTAPPAAVAGDGPEQRGRQREIVPGLTFRRIVQRKVPRRIFVLTVDLSQAVTLDVALARDRLGELERTSSMAARHGAVAAVNGDFGASSARPAHPFAEDGELVQTSRSLGTVFTIADDETVGISHPDVSITAVETDTEELWPIARWNQGPPQLGELVAFTAAGGDRERPPRFACNARLLATGSQNPGPEGVGRTYAVDHVECDADGIDVADGLVLSAQAATEEAVFLRSLTSGELLSVTWSVGAARVLDAIGGVPLLIADGQMVLGPCTTSFCRRHPRTAVGIDAEGHVLIVAVDGRRKRWSVGMSLRELARFMQSLGAQWALNLDGGGSTTMWIEGEVVNRPSSRRERSVTNALLVLPGPDPGQEEATG